MTPRDRVNDGLALACLLALMLASPLILSALYDELYGDWERDDCQTLADGGRPRAESLWISPEASRRLRGLLLFAMPAVQEVNDGK